LFLSLPFQGTRKTLSASNRNSISQSRPSVVRRGILDLPDSESSSSDDDDDGGDGGGEIDSELLSSAPEAQAFANRDRAARPSAMIGGVPSKPIAAGLPGSGSGGKSDPSVAAADGAGGGAAGGAAVRRGSQAAGPKARRPSFLARRGIASPLAGGITE
jgi:hypothetical protein